MTKTRLGAAAAKGEWQKKAHQCNKKICIYTQISPTWVSSWASRGFSSPLYFTDNNVNPWWPSLLRLSQTLRLVASKNNSQEFFRLSGKLERMKVERILLQRCLLTTSPACCSPLRIQTLLFGFTCFKNNKSSFGIYSILNGSIP